MSIKSLYFTKEKPLILNPETDEVENHLFFLPNGKINGLTENGNETIELLKLNRKRLVIWRKKILDGYLVRINRIFKDLLSNSIDVKQCRYAIKQVFADMIENKEATKPYSRFSFFIVNKFDVFVANQLELKQKEAVLRFFELFVKNEL